MTNEFALRFPGQFTVKEQGFRDNYSHSADENYVTLRDGVNRSQTTLDTNVSGMGRESVYPQGGQGLVSFDSAIKVILRWKADTDRSGTPDPNDTPNFDRPIYLKVKVAATASAFDVARNARDASENTHDTEHVELSIVADGSDHSETSGVPVITGDNGSAANQNKTTYIKLSPKSSPSEPLTIFKIKAKGEVEANRKSPSYRGGYETSTGDSSMLWNYGSAFVGFEFTGELTNYFLSISSDLEDSWKKLVGELPQDYKKYYGQYGWQPDPDKAQQVSADPLIWRVKCRRGADGSMTVESAAIYWPFFGGVAYGGGVFNAHVAGVSNPSYKWNLTGGSPSPNAGEELDKNQPSVNVSQVTRIPDMGTVPEIDGIDLGRQSDGSLTFSSSTIDLEVTDPATGVKLTNAYTVNWHPVWEVTKTLPDSPTIESQIADLGKVNPGDTVDVNVVNHSAIDWNATVDNITPILALAPGGGAVGDAWEAYKAAMKLSKLGDTAEEVNIVSTGLGNNDNKWKDSVINNPAHVSGLTPEMEARVAAGDASDIYNFDCYMFRIRTHHRMNAKADQYGTHGFHSSNHHLSNDITDDIDNLAYYVRRNAPKPTFPS